MGDLAYLAAAAPDFVEDKRPLAGGGYTCTVVVHLVSGRQLRGPVTLAREGGTLMVRPSGGLTELPLPEFCPERHINADGSFCLGRDRTLAGALANPVAWWQRLLQYLREQVSAGQRKRWNPAAGVDHGDAAEIQEKIEVLLATLPAELRQRLGQRGHGLAPLMAWAPGIRIDRTGSDFVNGRKPCICGCGQLRRSCGWSAVLARLSVLIGQREAAITRFWAGHAGRPCCGARMQGCRLAS